MVAYGEKKTSIIFLERKTKRNIIFTRDDTIYLWMVVCLLLQCQPKITLQLNEMVVK